LPTRIGDPYLGAEDRISRPHDGLREPGIDAERHHLRGDLPQRGTVGHRGPPPLRRAVLAGLRPSREAAAPQARARRTRAAVVEAARTLFLDRGYAATTVEAISDLSDTPQPTVYRLFASKLGILKAVLDVSIAGDEEPIAMVDRPQVRAVDAHPDPTNTLAGFAALLRELMARTAPVHRILEDAARSDQAAATLLAEIARQRHDGQRRITRALARVGALRSGLREREAADIVHALASPEVYRLLVFDRGWTGEQYERWLTSILTDQLLR